MQPFPRYLARKAVTAPLLRHSSASSSAAQSQCTSQIRWLRLAQWRGYASDPRSSNARKVDAVGPSMGKKEARQVNDFKIQLFESTNQRVKQQREQEERLAHQRSVGGGSIGQQFGFLLALALASGFFYYLGLSRAPDPSSASTLPLTKTPKPQHDVSDRNLQAAWTDLKNIVGQENVSTSKDDITQHSGSSWSTYPDTEDDRPFVVIRPASTEEVSQIMKVCHTRRIPVTAYSGGTSLEGHFAATRGGVCVDFSRMDQILAVHEDDMDVVVQPSVGYVDLNDVLEEYGLFFPPDPGPGAMIGGMIGTSCSGTNAYRYGTMRDWVLSITAVLPDGTIIRTRQRPRKSSAGYNLHQLLVGSEGTLGLVTEATLKLTSAPKNPRVALATFPTIRDAADCVQKVVREGTRIEAVEILDDVQMKAINDSNRTAKQWAEEPTLLFKFAGTTTKQVDESISAVRAAAKKSRNKTFEFAKTKDEAEELWSARKEALWAVMALARDPDHDRVWTTDVAVPMSKLSDIIEVTKKDMVDSGLLGAIVGHVGDGNFHSIILYNPATDRATVEGVVHRMIDRAQEMEGTCTGEHGVGLVKRDYLVKELGGGNDKLGQDTLDAMRAIKRAWDPLCLLNCDKVVRMDKDKGKDKK